MTIAIVSSHPIGSRLGVQQAPKRAQIAPTNIGGRPRESGRP
jgi:hypothetical protein